jgi:hypothetical protein
MKQDHNIVEVLEIYVHAVRRLGYSIVFLFLTAVYTRESENLCTHVRESTR